MSPPVPFVVDTCLLFHVSSWLLRMLLRCVCVCALVGSLYNSSGPFVRDAMGHTDTS
jgi:hypothetical protein